MHRFFTTEIQPNTAVVRGDDVKHIAKVLRLREGDVVQLCDGRGNECDAAIASVSPDAVTFDTQPWHAAVTEPDTKLTLFQCLPKAGKMEIIIQKCVELGISAFVPVQSERCVV
ncbi:MAG: 16S rRNA (uracil(1498)-N(3))-methyltransferase, partial [Clostridia bacterium]|nr:16S rRNA (uracil(1498)-N(3))-methyltransferase [Clostridia bacterium]